MSDVCSADLDQRGGDHNSWLKNELLGNCASLTNTARLAETQSQFGAAVSAARAGTGDIGDVTNLADYVLSAGQAQFGGTKQFATLEQMVRSTVSTLGKDLGLPGFANGGISYGPQVARVSEGAYPAEAHVPLPDGRAIPVRLEGASTGNGATSQDIGEVAVILTRLLSQQAAATQTIPRLDERYDTR